MQDKPKDKSKDKSKSKTEDATDKTKSKIVDPEKGASETQRKAKKSNKQKDPKAQEVNAEKRKLSLCILNCGPEFAKTRCFETKSSVDLEETKSQPVTEKQNILHKFRMNTLALKTMFLPKVAGQNYYKDVQQRFHKVPPTLISVGKERLLCYSFTTWK